MRNKLTILFLLNLLIVSAQTDSLNSYYLDKDGIKHDCVILVNKSKKLRYIHQFDYFDMVDSLSKYERRYSENSKGYAIGEVFYKSFTVDIKDKRISFFAKEITSGNVVLYFYNGERLDGESIYIFKKQNETAYTTIQKNIEKVTNQSSFMMKDPMNYGQNSAPSTTVIKFYDERPYLDFFRNYLSDCNLVYTKFKSDWYTFESIETMFKDYNKCK